jgi:uncharacterized damage-inducible protein DinB
MRTRVSLPLPAQEPALGRPGAGVSSIETFTLRTLARPLTSLIPWSTGLRAFQKEGDRILAAVANRPSSALTTRVLVPRQLALEDSSRFWSAAMVARHLMVTGEKIARIIVCLGRGEMCSEPINIADVKPDPETPVSVFVEYCDFLAQFGRTMREDVVNRRSLLTHPHPWSGQMTAHQWLMLAAMHQRIHRAQLERILRKLR